MRDIMFRGRDIKTSQWVCGDLCHWDNRIYIASSDIDWNDICWGFEEVDPSTVGQYTGIKVKTGEVYQDDIGKSIDGMFLIVWDEERAAFMMQFYDYPQERLYLEEMWEDSEVIGNLHDNQNLLESEG